MSAAHRLRSLTRDEQQVVMLKLVSDAVGLQTILQCVERYDHESITRRFICIACIAGEQFVVDFTNLHQVHQLGSKEGLKCIGALLDLEDTTNLSQNLQLLNELKGSNGSQFYKVGSLHGDYIIKQRRYAPESRTHLRVRCPTSTT
jgi:hypothetical protein